MLLPQTDTEVLFPAAATSAEATVLVSRALPDGVLVITDRTPFHPVDPGWPDQGPDRGTLFVNGAAIPVVDVPLGATDGADLFLGSDIPVRRGTEGWSFLVVHQLAAGAQAPEPGTTVTLAVDEPLRAALSAGHTGCHLASLALNAALAGRWRKEVSLDGLGSPDFDQLAITESRIVEGGSVDTYRVGKSLRKKGFDSEGLFAALPEIASAANALLGEWVATDAPVRLDTDGPGLTDRRYWSCELPAGTPRIPCGGTHVASLAEFSGIAIELSYDETAGELVMTTRTQPALR